MVSKRRLWVLAGLLALAAVLLIGIGNIRGAGAPDTTSPHAGSSGRGGAGVGGGGSGGVEPTGGAALAYLGDGGVRIAPPVDLQPARMEAVGVWRSEVLPDVERCRAAAAQEAEPASPRGAREESGPVQVAFTFVHRPEISTPNAQRFVVERAEPTRGAEHARSLTPCLARAVGTTANLSVPPHAITSEQSVFVESQVMGPFPEAVPTVR